MLGDGAWSLGLVVLVGFLLGKIPWLRDEATTIATTGLVVLATDSMAETQLLGRLIDTSIGVLVGLAVNLLVWPPAASPRRLVGGRPDPARPRGCAARDR